MASADPNYSGPALIPQGNLAPRYGFAHFEALKANGLAIEQSNPVLQQKLARGEYAIALTNDYGVRQEMEKGMSLFFTFQSLRLALYGVKGILLAWAFHYAPMAYALLRPALGFLWPLLRAARVHGVVGVRRLWVLLPPLLPSLLAAGGLVYLALLGNFGVPAVLGLPARVYVLPTLAYARLNSPLSPDPIGEAAALGLPLRPRALLEAASEGPPSGKPLYAFLFALYALLYAPGAETVGVAVLGALNGGPYRITGQAGP
mgnify:FL=1